MLEKLIKNIDRFYTYEEYKILVDDLIVQKKSTSLEGTEALYQYSLLNQKRMQRLDKTIQISTEIISKMNQYITKPQQWVVITESWCGDAAQNLPILAKIAATSNVIDFKIVLRDRNLPFMDAFLTNGSSAIPKLIIFDKDYKLINSWGPRPSTATKMVETYKIANGKIDAEFKKQLQVWYNKDKGQTLQKDILELIA